jgi:transposase
VVHPNAPLSPEGRFRLVRLVVEDGWPVAWAAERFQVSRTTAYRGWAAIARWAGLVWSTVPADLTTAHGRPSTPGP